MHAFVLGVLRHPLGGGDLVFGQAGVRPRGTDALDQLGALARQLAQQEPPAAAGDVDVLAADPVQDRRAGLTDVEGCTDLFAGLLGDAADLDDDGTVVDLEPVDVIGRGATAHLVEALDHQGSIAAVRETGGGEQASGTRSDDDGVE